MSNTTKADMQKIIDKQADYIDELQQRRDEHGIETQHDKSAADRLVNKIERLSGSIVKLRVAYAELRGYVNSVIDLQAPPVEPKEGCSQCGHGAVHASLPANFPTPPSEIDSDETGSMPRDTASRY